MCFSPSVSFTASAALAVIGGMTSKKVTRKEETYYAAIPLLFAVQQFIEGILWLELLQPDSPQLQYILIQIYVIFAGMVWPVLAGLSLWMMEPDVLRKRCMMTIMLVGSGIALYTWNGLLQYGVTARITDYCILYEYPVEQGYTMLISYVIATCAAFFFSSQRGIQLIGAVNIIVFIIAYRFYHYHLVSVWCLFAAIVSGLIYFYFAQLKKRKDMQAVCVPVA